MRSDPVFVNRLLVLISPGKFPEACFVADFFCFREAVSGTEMPRDLLRGSLHSYG